MSYIGIDVGVKGGIVELDDAGNLLGLYPIPFHYKDGIKWDELVALLSRFEGLVAIEDVHSLPGTSAKSNFNFGEVRGFKRACCMSAGCPVEMVPPKHWQRAVWEEPDVTVHTEGKQKGKRDPKATSLKAAKRLWPMESFHKSDRATTPHDGLIDAALIAEYLRRKHEIGL